MGLQLLPMASTESLCRQNFDEAVEEALNDQINMDLYASNAYQAAARHFERDDVALFGFAKYFQHQSDEEREHAEKLQKYLNLRGGRPALKEINDHVTNLRRVGTGLGEYLFDKQTLGGGEQL